MGSLRFLLGLPHAWLAHVSVEGLSACLQGRQTHPSCPPLDARPRCASARQKLVLFEPPMQAIVGKNSVTDVVLPHPRGIGFPDQRLEDALRPVAFFFYLTWRR